MPSATSPIVRNARSLERDIRAMGEVSSDDMEEALEGAAEILTGEMRDRVPVASGQLQESITYETDEKDKDGVRVVAGFEREGFYAHLVEFGYSRQPAQPFMRPAFDLNVSKMLSTINLRLRAGIIG